MVENPLGLIDEFASAGADMISVHSEIGPLVPAALQRIRDRKLAVPSIRKLRSFLYDQGVADRVKIEADGGIRAETVPGLRAAGADLVVMGSLAFKSDDPNKTFR